jgi:hypothetical protein
MAACAARLILSNDVKRKLPATVAADRQTLYPEPLRAREQTQIAKSAKSLYAKVFAIELALQFRPERMIRFSEKSCEKQRPFPRTRKIRIWTARMVCAAAKTR